MARGEGTADRGRSNLVLASRAGHGFGHSRTERAKQKRVWENEGQRDENRQRVRQRNEARVSYPPHSHFLLIALWAVCDYQA